MVGSRFLRPIEKSTTRRAARGGFRVALAAAVVLPASFAAAAEPTASDPAAVGTPVVLFSPSHPASPPTAPKPLRPVAAAAPAKRQAAPARPTPAPATPVTSAPLIPPAALPARLGPPPSPHGELPMATDMQPLAKPAEPPAPAGGGKVSGKPPAG